MSLVFAFREKENPNVSILVVPFDLATGVVSPQALDEFVRVRYQSGRRHALWDEALQRWLPIPTAVDMQRMIISLAAEKKTYHTLYIWVDMPEQWSLSAAVLTSIESFENAAEKAAERAKAWLPSITQSLTGYLDLGLAALTEFTQGLNCAAPAAQDLISFSATSADKPEASSLEERLEVSSIMPASYFYTPDAGIVHMTGVPINGSPVVQSATPSPASVEEGSESFVELPSDSFVELPTDSVLFASDQLQSDHDARVAEMAEQLRRSVAQTVDQERLNVQMREMAFSPERRSNLCKFQNMGFTTAQLLKICTILQQLPEHTEFPVIFETVAAQLKI